MKYTIGLLLCWVGLSPASAQKIVEKHMDFAQKNLVVLNIQIADSIQVHTWNKKEVYVKASIDVNDNKDNDLYSLVFGDSGNTVAVVAQLDFEKARKRSDSCHCCNGTNSGGNFNNCIRAQVFYDVYLPENADLSVETINANIIIAGKTAAVRAHTISGFVDLTVAPERKADLKLNTVTGTVYTNIAMNTPPPDHTAATHITELINGGGKPINLESISGNIFLRKSE